MTMFFQSGGREPLGIFATGPIRLRGSLAADLGTVRNYG